MNRSVLLATGALVLLNLGLFAGFLMRRGPASKATGDTHPPAALSAGSQRGLYAVTGEVRELRPDGSNVVIRHETIPGFMMAMTMPFSARDPREIASLQPGDRITFRLLVTDQESWIDSVEKVGQVASPAFDYQQSRVVRDVEPLNVGDLMPEYPFTNQFGKPARLTDFRGRTVALTFIFTRCPLPDFCPRMLKNFTEAATALAGGSLGTNDWHLLTMTIDPTFDSPTVLLGQAQRVNYDPARWTFLTGALIEIDAITEQLGLLFRRQTPTALPDHNLRTVVIDAEGRLRKIIVGNTWKSSELIEAMADAASHPWSPPVKSAGAP